MTNPIIKRKLRELYQEEFIKFSQLNKHQKIQLFNLINKTLPANISLLEFCRRKYGAVLKGQLLVGYTLPL